MTSVVAARTTIAEQSAAALSWQLSKKWQRQSHCAIT